MGNSTRVSSNNFSNTNTRAGYTEPEAHCSEPRPRIKPDIHMAAFRDDFNNVRSGSQLKNRIKQLESLRRMEEKYKNPVREEDPKRKFPGDDDPSEPDPGSSSNSNSGNKMSMYVMDISEVLSEKACVSWRPPKPNANAPRDKMLYSLVLGKGELIVFGGIQKSPSLSFPSSSYKCVSNSTHIVTAPRNVV